MQTGASIYTVHTYSKVAILLIRVHINLLYQQFLVELAFSLNYTKCELLRNSAIIGLFPSIQIILTEKLAFFCLLTEDAQTSLDVSTNSSVFTSWLVQPLQIEKTLTWLYRLASVFIIHIMECWG